MAWQEQWRRVLVVVLGAVAVAVGPTGAHGQGVDPESIVPLPAKLEVVAPGADVPADIARFQGAWVGTWDDEFRNILVVERVAADGGATIVYGWADSVFVGISRGWLRGEAKIEKGALKVTRFGWSESFVFDGPDRLSATSTQRSGRVAAAVFARLDAATLPPKQTSVAKIWPGERVRIPHLTLRMADGARPAELDATLYAPRKKDGPAPLAIISHGSDIGRDLLKTFSFYDTARWLLDHGYAVLVPMRRGRGTSDGEYGEDFYNTDRNGNVIDGARGLSEAVEDLDSAIAYGRSLPFVRPGPVLLLGQSRGGFLSVHYAGLKPDEVVGVINVVGGWMSGRTAKLNIPVLQQAGRAAGAQVKQLWLYAENDSFYAVDYIRDSYAAFGKAGGTARFEFYRDIPGNGHRLMQYPGRWREAADEFLRPILVLQELR